MAQTAPAAPRVDRTPTLDATPAETASATPLSTHVAPSELERDKVLPLPGWLVKVYFIFPVVLYIPDAIFNYFVYSDGATARSANPVIQAGFTVLWAFLALGVVGMAYLLSVLAPWHWSQGHKVQAFFCAVGVLVATGITTWCSLAFRSENFTGFVTDKWVYSIWPQLQSTHFSLTMLLVAIAPPFWGLFWAVVQPTSNRRSLRQLQESHEERLLRTQQDAELKQLRADANAKVREAQLRGMAATAAAARKQAAQLISQRRSGAGEGTEPPAAESGHEKPVLQEVPNQGASYPALGAPALERSDLGSFGEDTDHDAGTVFSLPQLNSLGHGTDMSIMNHASAAPAAAHAATALYGNRIQPALISDVDVDGTTGMPANDALTFAPRRPPMLGGTLTPAINPFEVVETDGMTGTTGPRPALRRSAQPSTLVSAMNGPNPAHVQIVTETMRELNIPVSRRTLTASQQRLLVPRVAEKLGCDDTFARAVIGRVMKADAHRNG
ncbi:MAG: hypothetical protein ACLQUY_19415 [Ktedonobacterales bacterium]